MLTRPRTGDTLNEKSVCGKLRERGPVPISPSFLQAMLLPKPSPMVSFREMGTIPRPSVPMPTDTADARTTLNPSADAVHPPLAEARPVAARGSRHPLGPLVHMKPLDGPTTGRVYAAGVLAGVVAVFIVAANLTPDAHHVGTHRQLGLQPCSFIVVTRLPCPTCGMTTAFAHTVRGQVLAAMQAQPAGFLLAIATAGAGLLAGGAVIPGRRPSLNWYRVSPTALVWWATGFLVVAWGVKIVLVLADRPV